MWNWQYETTIEIDNYLNELITPIPPENTDVYQWWRTNKTFFPILSRMARKYLSIPATSVPSEQLLLMREIKLPPREIGHLK